LGKDEIEPATDQHEAKESQASFATASNPASTGRNLVTGGHLNLQKRDISFKIVYYGIANSGKTTNLHFIHRTVDPHAVGEMVSIDTEVERTLYFDLLPLEIGRINGFRVRFQLYTVPGMVLYQQTRLSVLKGASAIVFVADSRASKLQENIESFREMIDSLRRMGRPPEEFPIIMQWNNRDLSDILPVPILEQYLNPCRAPSFEADQGGRGVVETLRCAINTTLRAFENRLAQ
jgi:mutual gliding-motility protein MglA